MFSPPPVAWTAQPPPAAPFRAPATPHPPAPVAQAKAVAPPAVRWTPPAGAGALQRKPTPQGSAQGLSGMPHWPAGTARAFPGASVVQRMESLLNPASNLAPTGYGAVTLSATLNGHDLGMTWSRQTTYSEGTEHAEDQLIDLVDSLDAAAGGYSIFATDLQGIPNLDAVIASLQNGEKNLVINNLSASPCSSTEGTCDKGDCDGCAERLRGLARRGYTIRISCDHYYQPKGVDDAKQKSKDACAAMRGDGITITVAKP